MSTREVAARSTLAERGWLASCPNDFSAALLSAGRVRRLAQGEALHHAGDVEGGMWGLVDGQLISSTGVAGPNTSLVAMFVPGEWIGTGPISGYRRQLNLNARTSATVIMIPQLAVRRLLAAHPEWWEHFSRLHFQLMAKFGLLAADLQISSPLARVAGALLNAVGLRLEGDRPVRFQVSQREIGQMANLSHFPTGRILRRFVAEGMISARYGEITIEQPMLLREIAEGGD